MVEFKNELCEAKKEDLQTASGAERISTQRVFSPRVDILENQDALLLMADMPGVEDSTVEVTLEKNVLTIRGRTPPQVLNGYSLMYAEYEVGDYERSFTISDEIEREKIDASVKNGVLRLTLPKATLAKPRKIEVKAS